MELDSAKIAPSVNPLAAARLCACVVADVIRLESEQVCDCANCCETCVPIMLNDIISPLFSFGNVLLHRGQACDRCLDVRQWRRQSEGPTQGRRKGRRRRAKGRYGLTLCVHA